MLVKFYRYEKNAVCRILHKMHREGEIIDPQSYMFQLTINAPVEKGYTHEKIVNIIRSKFKTNIYFCLADEEGKRYHTHIFIVFSSSVYSI